MIKPTHVKNHLIKLSFLYKSTQLTRITSEVLYLSTEHVQKISTVDIKINDEKLNPLFLRLGIRQERSVLPLV